MENNVKNCFCKYFQRVIFQDSVSSITKYLDIDHLNLSKWAPNWWTRDLATWCPHEPALHHLFLGGAEAVGFWAKHWHPQQIMDKFLYSLSLLGFLARFLPAICWINWATELALLALNCWFWDADHRVSGSNSEVSAGWCCSPVTWLVLTVAKKLKKDQSRG